MRRFIADWPGIELGLSEPSTDPDLYSAIERGDLDLSFCSLPLHDGPFEALDLMSDPYVLLVPAGHSVCRVRRVSLTDLAELVLIGASQCSSGVLVEAGFERSASRSNTPSSRTTTAPCKGSSRPDSGRL